MYNTFKNILILTSLLFTTVCFQSCKTEGCTEIEAINYDSDADTNDGSCIFEGCTDANAENFDSNADQDDGSCTFARTKFLGQYGAGESCNGADAVGLEINIEESSTAFNVIDITNVTEGITISATVTGNTITIDDSFDSGGEIVNVTGSGTHSIVDGQDRIDAEYTFSIDGEVVSECVGVWLKVQ